MRELRRDEFRSHMAFLSDDLLEGRGTGTRGHELAARYIASQFEAFGLRPAGADGTYYQRVPLREISVDADRSELTITRNGTLVQLAWGADFLARGHATNPDALVDAPVVFVGYSVQTLDRRFNDYSGVDQDRRHAGDGAPPALPTELRAHAGALRENCASPSNTVPWVCCS
jgi:hypothetical protein